MGYACDGARWRRRKMAKYGTAMALAGPLMAVATKVVARHLKKQGSPHPRKMGEEAIVCPIRNNDQKATAALS